MTPTKVPANASKGGQPVGLLDGSERIRDTRRAPKGSERGGCFEVAVEGAFGEIFERVFEKGCEGVFRRMRRGLPEDAKGSSGGFPRGCLRRRFAKGSSGRFSSGRLLSLD